jgi:hypothetical protein
MSYGPEGSGALGFCGAEPGCISKKSQVGEIVVATNILVVHPTECKKILKEKQRP